MEHFGGGLSCRRRTGFAYFPRQRDRVGIAGSDLKTLSASSIFGGRAIPVEGWTLRLGEALGAGYGHEQHTQ